MARSVYREKAGGGVLKIPSWICLNQATPDTVSGLNPDTVSLFTDSNDSYDSTTNGVKLLLKLPGPKLIAKYSMTLGKIVSDVNNIESVINSTGSQEDYSLKLRVRAITASFDITNRTYANSVTSPDITIHGTTYENQFMGTVEVSAGAGIRMALGSRSLNGMLSTLVTTGIGRILTTNFVTSTVLEVYGFIVDIKLIMDSVGTNTVTSSAGRMNLYLPKGTIYQPRYIEPLVAA